jgi:hypothetical protein
MKIIKVIIYSLLTCLSLAGFSASADSNAFQIELVVFSQQQPTTEMFEQTSSLLDWPGNLTELSAYPVAPDKILTPVYTALGRHEGYRPLLHVAWIQNIADANAGEPVHIQNGDINGFVALKRGELLQLAIDMEYAPSDGSLIYRLHEQRQLRLEEPHYFDHPKFGVIAQIKRIDKTR